MASDGQHVPRWTASPGRAADAADDDAASELSASGSTRSATGAFPFASSGRKFAPQSSFPPPLQQVPEPKNGGGALGFLHDAHDVAGAFPFGSGREQPFPAPSRQPTPWNLARAAGAGDVDAADVLMPSDSTRSAGGAFPFGSGRSFAPQQSFPPRPPMQPTTHTDVGAAAPWKQARAADVAGDGAAADELSAFGSTRSAGAFPFGSGRSSFPPQPLRQQTQAPPPALEISVAAEPWNGGAAALVHHERSSSLIRPAEDGVVLSWEDLWVSAPSGGSRKAILSGVSGIARPGEVLAIMGPSGCGKSTLLDALAGRLGSKVTQKGDILINGRRQKLAYGTSAYVTQDQCFK